MSTFNAGAIEANLTLGRSGWVKDLRKTQKEIQDLERKSISIGVDLDDDNAKVAMDNLELMLDDLENTTYTPKADLDIDKALAAIERLEQKLESIERDWVQIRFDVDADRALVELDNLENLLDVLEADDLVIKVIVDAERAKVELIELSLQMQRMSLAGINIDVDVNNYAGALARLLTLQAQIDLMDGQDIDINIDINRALLAGLVGSSSGGGGGSLGLLRILLYAILILSPILAVAISSLTAAIVAFAAALVGAAGAALVLGGGLVGLVQLFNDTDPSEYTPAMQAFADSIDAVKAAYDEFLGLIGDAGFTLMAQALQLVADILPELAPLFNATAEALGPVLDSIGDFVKSPEFKEMIAFFSDFGVDMLVTFLKIGGNLIQFFGRLFQAIAPFAEGMMKDLEETTAGWAEWADDLENNDSFQKFLANAEKYGPMVLEMLGALFGAFEHLGDALEPFAGPMLEGLTAFFNAFQDIPAELLTVFIGLLAGLWLGLNVIAPLIGAIVGGLGALSTALGIGMAPLLLIIAAIAAFGFALYQLWNENEEFRQTVIDTWNAIWEAIEPIVTDIVDLFMENWPAIKEFVTGLWEDLKSIIGDAMIVIMAIIRGVTNTIQILWGIFGGTILSAARIVFAAIGGVIKGHFQIIKGIFQIFSGLITGDWSKMWEGVKNIGRGAMTVLKTIGNGIKDTFISMVNGVKGALDRFIGFFRGLGGKISSAVKNMWDGIWDGFKNIINKVIGAWNNISFSVDIPDKIPGLPDEFRVSTPNVPYLATGAYLTEPTLNVAGEAGPEIVAPEPVLERIVRENSGSNLDYGRLAAAIATALASVWDRVGALTREDLERIVASIVPSVQVDARSEGATVGQLAGAIGFELRRLGYGGKDNV